MTLRYMEGFEKIEGSGLDLGLGASDVYFPVRPESFVQPEGCPVGINPNHIGVVEGKYYFGGKEISVEEGDKLLDEAIKNGEPYTIFQTIARGEKK